VIVSSRHEKLAERHSVRLPYACVSVASLSRHAGSGGAARVAGVHNLMRVGGTAPSQTISRCEPTRWPTNPTRRSQSGGTVWGLPTDRGAARQPCAAPASV
jgi:hypothetical protein